MNTKVYRGVDIFKLGAAIGVVAIHTEMPFLEIIGRLGVPFFVIISGFFFFKHYLKLDNKLSKIEYLKKFESRILFLFLTWQVIYLPLAFKKTQLFFIANGASIRSVAKYIFDFLFRLSPTDVNGWFPSWYLMAMMIGLPIFVFLYSKLNIILLGIISIIFEIYFILSSEFSFITHLSNRYKAVFPRVFIYLYIGLLIAKNISKCLRKNIDLYFNSTIVLMVLFLLENYLVFKWGGKITSDETILTVPTSTIVTILALKYEPTNIQSTKEIRSFSTFLYCSQVWCIFVSRHFLHFNGILNEVSIFCLTIILSWIGYVIYVKIKQKTQWSILNFMV